MSWETRGGEAAATVTVLGYVRTTLDIGAVERSRWWNNREVTMTGV